MTFKVEHTDGSVTTHKALEGTKWADWIGSSLDDLTQEGCEIDSVSDIVCWTNSRDELFLMDPLTSDVAGKNSYIRGNCEYEISLPSAN